MTTTRKVTFTSKRIADFTCPPEKNAAFLWDNDTKGLGLKASTGGSKQYVLETRLQNGKTARLTIGSPKTWTIDAARNEARRLQVLVDQGIDPREIARKHKEEKAAAEAANDEARRETEHRQRYTLRALCLAYTDHLKSQGKTKTARDAQSAFKVHVMDAFLDIANTPAKEVSPHQIATLIRKVRESGKTRTAGILRNYLVAAFNTARRAPFDSGISSSLIEFHITTNPAEIIPAIPVQRGDRVLSIDELRKYINTLTLSNQDSDRVLLLGLLCGGQRMAQLLRANVCDYDQHTHTLRLLDGKGKRISPREHLLPVGQKANELIRTFLRKKRTDNEKLFSVSERTISNRVSEVAGIITNTSFNLRDIRRTCETILASMGINKDTRAQLLSHGISGVQAAHYDRHDYLAEKRAALTAWEAKLDDILSTPN